jgi:circadian clock protein KaiC
MTSRAAGGRAKPVASRRHDVIARPERLTKSATGIAGFDQMTRGGLPCGRTALLTGGPGCGKTIFSLQFLKHGATHLKEPGIFIAFEENPRRLLSNAAAFGWNLNALKKKGSLHFIDAQPEGQLVQTGDFDLCGLLASLQAQIKITRARRIVFDAIDVLLALLPDNAARRREIYRLHEWLLRAELTALLTEKSGSDDTSNSVHTPFGFMQFAVDCSVILSHDVRSGVSQRSLRVQKYRGSAFDENEAPFIIGSDGFDVGISQPPNRTDVRLSSERVTSGVRRLDSMLGGGYYRGASVLITGFPGTAKTTLSGAFAEASCRRGDRTVFVSFDSDGAEVARNLRSVGIRLDPHMRRGTLRMVSARTMIGSAETLLVRIKALTKEHRARCLVIDPVSTFSKAGNELTAHAVAERLIDWSKSEGITLLCTSLLQDMSARIDGGTPLQISTFADTWIHVNYVVQAGERNRGISIIKSRGTEHSNQVRELILGDSGVTVADIYTAEGEVLMGTLRWEKENAERVAQELADISSHLQRAKLVSEEAELRVRAKTLEAELTSKQVEKALLARTQKHRKEQRLRARQRLQELRGDRRAIRPRE